MVGRRRKFWFPESPEWPLNRFLGIILTKHFHFTKYEMLRKTQIV